MLFYYDASLEAVKTITIIYPLKMIKFTLAALINRAYELSVLLVTQVAKFQARPHSSFQERKYQRRCYSSKQIALFRTNIQLLSTCLLPGRIGCWEAQDWRTLPNIYCFQTSSWQRSADVWMRWLAPPQLSLPCAPCMSSTRTRRNQCTPSKF